MSSTPTQPDDGSTATADPPTAQRLNDWRTRLDAFATAFDAEITAILTTLSSLTFDEVEDAPRTAPGDQTMEFTLPTTPPAVPAALKPTPQSAPTSGSMPAAASEPNRLAALKAKLSQQMASTGHPQSTAARTVEDSRS